MGDQVPSKAKFRKWAKWRAFVVATSLLAVGPTPAVAVQPSVSVINPVFLRFGTFAVPTSGFREVTPTGSVTSGGIFALGIDGTGPARFTVQYDRGNNSKRRVDILVDIVFSTPPDFSGSGLTARLSRYQTDLPGYGFVAPGQIIRIELSNCLQRVCSKSFNLGGRLDVNNSFGGGLVEIPIPVDTVGVSER